MLARSAALLLALCLPAFAAAQDGESSEFIQVVDQADRREMVLVVGPVNLPAGASHEHGGHGAVIPLQEVRFPRSGWLRGFEADMVDASGAPLEVNYVHHVNVIDPDNRELFSPIARRIMAAGPETGRMELPGSMGLPVPEGQRLLVRAVFHNPTERDLRDGYLRIRFLFTPSVAGATVAGVFPVYMDVRPPVGKKSFDLPPGAFTQSWQGSPAIDGRLLGAAGHMHQHGTSLRLEDVTAGKTLWEVAPVTDAEGRIVDIPVGEFWKKGGVRLRAGSVYRLTVAYENPSGSPIPDGGMGTLGGFFIPEPGEAWPDVEKADPLYVADMRHQRGEDAQIVPGQGGETDHHGHAAPAPAPAAAGPVTLEEEG